jgi:O-antigen/teichoic acid export membrane protein
MKQHFSKLGKQTLVYGISGTALQAVGLLTLPIFARVFSPTEYGVLELVTVGIAATMLFADLSLRSASQRSFFDYAHHQDSERRSVVCTALTAAVLTSVILALAVALARGPLAEGILEDEQYSTLLLLAALSIPLAVLANMLRDIMRLHFRAWHYAASATLGAVVVGGLGAALVLWTDAGVDGVLIGVLAGNAVAAVYGIAVIRGDAIGRLSWSELKTMLAFGLPLIPAAAALWGVAFLDRVMLSQLGNLADVGEYAIAARFATVVMLGVTAFGLAFSPFLLSLWSEDPEMERQVRARTLTYLSVILAGLSLVLGLFAREIILVVAPDFEEAHELVGVLCMGVTVFGIANVTTAGMVLARRTRMLALYSLGALVANFVLALVLIPPLGGLGAALAALGGYCVLAGGYYVHSQRLYPTPYRPWKTVAALAAAAVLLPLGLLPIGAASLAIKLAAIVAFVAILLVFRVLTRSELTEIVAMARRAGARIGGAGSSTPRAT